jgi:hypothetical protein
MSAKACSAALNGIEACPIEVEVNAGWGGTLIVIIVSIPPQVPYTHRRLRRARQPQLARNIQLRIKSARGGRVLFRRGHLALYG